MTVAPDHSVSSGLALGRRWSIGAYISAVIVVQALLLSALITVASIEDYGAETFLLSAGGSVIVLLIGVLLRLRIARSVQALTAAVESAAQGDLSTRVPPSGPRELALLGERFNELVEARERSELAITDLYEAELGSNERLRELDSLKDAFLMAISHDLRTPLTSVVGYAGLLDDPGLDLSEAERRDCVVRIVTQARRLERLLRDLLDVERMTRGMIETHLALVPLRDLITRVIDVVPNAARVELDVASDVIVSADPGLLERVIENLIVNAVKHTPPDTSIWVRAEEDDSDVILIVEDEGSGVSDDIKTKIFEPFQQGEPLERYPGTGVGLALVAEFAKLHGGHAWVEDRATGGSSFRVSLPAATAATAIAG